MSRRFPITAAGDPHAPPTTHLYVHSVVSLLSLPTSNLALPPAPLEHLDLNGDYLAYLQATHIVPLQILQALLPLLRATPSRAQDARTYGLGRQSIVVCLPAMDARVGLPFASAQAMSAAATLRGVEVLRRELRASAASSAADAADAMRNIKVVVVDVGAVGPAVGAGERGAALEALEEWTPGEQASYGAAFVSLLEQGAPSRTPSNVSAFVHTVVDVVSNGRKGEQRCSAVGVYMSLGRMREFVFGDRVVVGAGGTCLISDSIGAYLTMVAQHVHMP